jgi:hypothetical protein
MPRYGRGTKRSQATDAKRFPTQVDERTMSDGIILPAHNLTDLLDFLTLARK